MGVPAMQVKQGKMQWLIILCGHADVPIDICWDKLIVAFQLVKGKLSYR